MTEASSKKCSMATCLAAWSAWGLIVWGALYSVNSLIKVVSFWSMFPPFFLAKLFLFRLGITLAAVLFGAVSLHLIKHGCRN